MVPLTEPDIGVKVLLAEKFTPSVATSKPVGAVTVTSADKFTPVTVSVCAAEAVPAVVVKPVKAETEGVTLGDEETANTATLAQSLETIILEIVPAAAAVLLPCLIETAACAVFSALVPAQVTVLR